SAIAPDLVPISSVVPGYEFELWWGVFAPAGLPADIQELLNTKINAVINAPEMRQTFLNDGAEAAPTSAEDFGKRVADD
ncbi:tripartite tricarboxylate transporter substrate-binding protein, partial [Klebsiella pneumoniae]